jgi:DNA modification methylase
MSSPMMVGHIEQRAIDQLTEYPQNARTHSGAQVEQIVASVREFGFVNPILIGTDNGIIAGHARLRAARKLGMSEVPVIVLAHLTSKQRRALAIADNQLPLNAGWDEEVLRLELSALQDEDFDLQLMGFDDAELERLLAEQVASEEVADADALPAIPRVPVTLHGDLWVLGDHRLLCGDATRQEAIETVLGGKAVDMVFTDPPYNVAYEGKTAEKLKIRNDALGERFYEFLLEASANLMAVCRGAIYICMSSSELHTLHRAFTEAGGHWSTFVIWAKHHFTLGRSDYQRQYEPILYGWPKGAEHFWCGARNEGDVWFISRPASNREHPTAKPVELVERAVANSSKIGGTVLDPFAGSGTTLIACQRRKRRARLIEIDPRYADVICQRWQQFSGNKAVLDGDGRAFAEIAEERQKRAT